MGVCDVQAVLSTSPALQLPEFLFLSFAPATATRACPTSAAELLRALLDTQRFEAAARVVTASVDAWLAVTPAKRGRGSALWLPLPAVSQLLHSLEGDGLLAAAQRLEHSLALLPQCA